MGWFQSDTGSWYCFDENGIELTSQEKDSIKRLSEQYYGLLSKADRDYIGADQEEVYADSKPPIVVGIRQTSSATSAVTEITVPE